MSAHKFAGPSVLVGIDGSVNAESALLWAADWRKRHDWFLRVLLVRTHPPDFDQLTTGALLPTVALTVTNTDESERAQTFLAQYVANALADDDSSAIDNSAIETMIANGFASRVILDQADELDVDLLVVGRRGRGGFRRLLIGSVSDQCMNYADCDTVVVPEGFDPTERESVIVVGVDGSQAAQEALNWAVQHAPSYSARIIVVTTWAIPYGPIASVSGALQLVVNGPDVFAEGARRLASTAIEVATARHGSQSQIDIESFEADAGWALTEIAQRESAQMIVVGHRWLGVVTSALLGSVARHCVHHASCPVVVVRHHKSDQELSS